MGAHASQVASCKPGAVSAALLGLGTLACPYEPPPDLDDEVSDGDTTAPTDDRVNDGQGMGVIQPPRIADGGGLAPNAVVIGAPDEAWEGIDQTGQLSILVDDGIHGLKAPSEDPATIVEDWHAPECSDGQEFAWDLLEGRRLGAALTFYNREAGDDYEAHRSSAMAAAPTAGQQSGRVMNYVGCHSCAIFPRPGGGTGSNANVIGSRFGAAIAVGFFGAPDVTHPMGVEALVVGAPDLEGTGRVFILAESVFRAWNHPSPSSMNAGGLTGDRECQCLDVGGGGNSNCLPFTTTMQGIFPDEEFGAALAVADFDCDGLDDLAVGAPGATLPAMGFDLPQSGAVYVYFADDDGLNPAAPMDIRQGQFEVGGEPEVGDRFGSVLGVGNFDGSRRMGNGRSCFDLVIATPDEDDGAGEIQIFAGGPGGLDFGGPILDLDDILDASADPGDRFGASVVAGDFDSDGFDDLAIGAPGDGIGGSVTILPRHAYGARCRARLPSGAGGRHRGDG